MRFDQTDRLKTVLLKTLENEKHIKISYKNNNPYHPYIENDKVIFGNSIDEIELLRLWIIGNGIDYLDETTLTMFKDNPTMYNYMISMGVEFVFLPFKNIVSEIAKQLQITVE